MYRSFKACLGCLLLSSAYGFPQLSFAQPLTLFEETESHNQTNSERSSRIIRDGDGNILDAVYFKLIGTSRFGNSHIITVEDQAGEIFSINTLHGAERPILGYQEYQLVSVGPGHIPFDIQMGSLVLRDQRWD